MELEVAENYKKMIANLEAFKETVDKQKQENKNKRDKLMEELYNSFYEELSDMEDIADMEEQDIVKREFISEIHPFDLSTGLVGGTRGRGQGRGRRRVFNKGRTRGRSRGRGNTGIGIARRNINGLRYMPRNNFISDSLVADLKWVDPTLRHTNTANQYMSYRFRMNSPFDPDPVSSSQEATGFSEYAAFYGLYRVIKFRYDIEIVNTETFPVEVYVVPSPTDLGANLNTGTVPSENRYARSGVLSGSSGINKIRFRGTIDLAKYDGNALNYMGDDGFAAPTNASPNTVFYINIGAITDTNLTASGLVVRSKFVYTTLFTEAKYKG